MAPERELAHARPVGRNAVTTALCLGVAPPRAAQACLAAAGAAGCRGSAEAVCDEPVEFGDGDATTSSDGEGTDRRLRQQLVDLGPADAEVAGRLHCGEARRLNPGRPIDVGRPMLVIGFPLLAVRKRVRVRRRWREQLELGAREGLSHCVRRRLDAGRALESSAAAGAALRSLSHGPPRDTCGSAVGQQGARSLCVGGAPVKGRLVSGARAGSEAAFRPRDLTVRTSRWNASPPGPVGRWDGPAAPLRVTSCRHLLMADSAVGTCHRCRCAASTHPGSLQEATGHDPPFDRHVQLGPYFGLAATKVERLQRRVETRSRRLQ